MYSRVAFEARNRKGYEHDALKGDFSRCNRGDGHAYGLVTVFPDKLEIKGIALEDWLPYGKHENGTPLPGSDVLPKPQPTADGKMQFIELPVTMRA